jgi:hypothetical protein
MSSACISTFPTRRWCSAGREVCRSKRWIIVDTHQPAPDRGVPAVLEPDRPQLHQGVSRSHQKPILELGPRSNGSIAIFPSTSGTGITSELVWSNTPRGKLGVGFGTNGSAADPSVLREELIVQHDRYLEALGSSDVKGILEVMNDDVQTAMRDNVNDTGTLTNLDGKTAHESYYTALFDKYEMPSADMLRRACQDWYLFYEARLTVRLRNGDGSTMGFNVAEYLIPAHDGRCLASAQVRPAGPISRRRACRGRARYRRLPDG